eukprot:7506643-Ditylum_brightwellii.AAC.1
MLGIKLNVKDGLLTVECSYPSKKAFDELPRIWLTCNEVPWDQKILEADKSLTVPSCWDGDSEFLVALNADA